MKKWSLARAVVAVVLLCCALPVHPAQAKPLNALVWDAYFDAADLPREPGMGRLGDEFDWEPGFSYPANGKANPQEHGKMVSYILLKGLPDVVLHRMHDAFLPWQDPEVCDLTSNGVFAAELQRQGYPTLPDCRHKIQKRVEDAIRFIRAHDIKVVNMSHGTYFDRYIQRNPELLQAHYPKVDRVFIQKFLYDNFLALAELESPLFSENPDTLFVAAAGNNSGDVDNPIYAFWDPMRKIQDKWLAPTLFGSFTERFDNVVSVAVTYDGTELGEESNYGVKGVDFVKQVGAFSVPSKAKPTGWEFFSGTSSAAAETSRLYLQAYLAYGDNLNLTPELLKRLSRKVATPVDAFKDRIGSGGLLQDSVFLDALAKLDRPKKIVAQVSAEKGSFTEFHLPADLHVANHRMGCHSLVVDRQSRVWATLPWADLIVSFDPATGAFARYPLGEGVHTPDGISLDRQGRIWAGVDQPGGLVVIDPNQNPAQPRVFTPPGNFTGNITAVDSSGNVWASSHQARRLLRFDPGTEAFAEFPVATDWPLDVRADQGGKVWVAGMENFHGNDGLGALIEFDGRSGAQTYTPIVGEGDRTLEWVSPSRDSVVMTSGPGGIYILDRQTSAMSRVSRVDGRQYYWLARTPDENGSLFVLANDHADSSSLDLLDVKHPERIRSYALPTPGGAVREALGFDKAGDVWYCEYGTDVIGRLALPHGGPRS